MGVHGLWRLIEPSGKPVPLETLENKILAVDVSIWLHQAVKGFQDSKGAPIPNAHLLGIYHRVCKLLYFKVKPIFVFDGGVPVLKKETIAKRNQSKSKNESEAERLQKQLLSTLLQHSAISKVISEKVKAAITSPPKKSTHKNDNMYILPPSEHDSMVSSEEEGDSESTSETTDSSPTKHWDIHTIDMSSVHFKNLPADVRHEILSELKETRKQNSWGRLHELPKQSDDFSLYQMNRLLKRQAVQSALEDAEKEMGGHSLSLAELESLLKDHGVATTNDKGKRIASDENTRYLLIKDVKQAIEEARKQELKLESIREEISNNSNEAEETVEEKDTVKNKADLEFEKDLEEAIVLSLQEKPSTSKVQNMVSNEEINKLEFSFLENFNDADFESDSTEEVEVSVKKTFSSAHSYMTEYSGLTPNEIAKIIDNESKKSLQEYNVKKNAKQKSDKVEKKSNNDKFNVDILGTKNSSKKNKINFASLQTKPIEGIHKTTQILTKNVIQTEDHKEENKTDINSLQNKSVDINEVVETSTGNAFQQGVHNVSDDDIQKCVDDVEVMSDSGESSSSVEFLEVSKKLHPPTSVKIVMDPKMNSENDLFSDVFTEEPSKPKQGSFEIVIEPQSTLDDDIFSDIFETEINSKEKKIMVNENKSEMKDNSMEVQDIMINQKIEEKLATPKKDEPLKVTQKQNIAELENNEDKFDGKVSENLLEKQKSLKLNVNDTVEIDTENLAPIEKTAKLSKEKPNLTLEQMQELKNNLQMEKIDLLVEKSTRERMANNITDQMYQEAQDLLELFGVPYIIAPMEAEAQCAFLDTIELTDGTITDDSDIWLFGGRTVYKNFFNPSKYVMEFRAENIKHHFKLTREQMILLALLVGSDYTIGIRGIGPVTALEVLAAFPPSQSNEFSLSHTELLSGLKEFRSWFNKGKTAGPGRSALKNKLKNISFSDTFPSQQVVQAYLEPCVETSKEKFSWGKPDFTGLTDFAKEKFGWSSKKTEEILKPVIKKLEENQLQKSIKDYFKTKYKSTSTEVENKMSKRVKTAVDRIGKTPDELIAEEMEALSKAKHKRTKSKKGDKNMDKQSSSGKTDSSNSDSQKSHLGDEKTTKTLTKARSRKKKNEDISDYGKTNMKEGDKEDIEDFEKQVSAPKQRRIKKKNETLHTEVVNNLPVKKTSSAKQKNEMKNVTLHTEVVNNLPVKKTSSAKQSNIDSNKETNELELYENIAIELKQRRQRKNELSKKEDPWKRKQTKPQAKKNAVEEIPKDLNEDEEVKFLIATASTSLKRVEEIDQEVKSELEKDVKKNHLVNVHKKEVIHQKLRDRSDILKNKMKAIEVFRKSKRGPGYVEKRKNKKVLPKEDANLSESSGDE